MARHYRLILYLMLFAGLLSSSFQARAGQASSLTEAISKIDRDLVYLLTAPSAEQADYIVLLEDQADLTVAKRSAMGEGRKRLVYESLRATATSSQGPLLELLEAHQAAGHVSRIRSYTIVNALAVRGDAKSLRALAMRPEVAEILPDRPLSLPGRWEPPTLSASFAEFPWNLAAIHADAVWNSLDITGQGITVANMDSGVDFFHPGLRTHYRGYDGGTARHDYNWFDATGTYLTVPGDGLGHGTHTMGTMVGGEPGGPTVGVAPGADWIAVKVFDDGGNSSTSMILDGFQWILAPTDLFGASPDFAKAPDILCSSWGSEMSSDRTFLAAVRACRAAGILCVFSAGNEGPGVGSINSPASFDEAFAVGAVDRDNELARLSARGPSPWGEIKPEVVAPGMAILSTVPGGGYERGWNGTSMAAPHAAGVAALVLEAQRRYGPSQWTVDDTEWVLIESATDLGDAGPDNQSGWGLLNAYQAVSMLAPHGTVQGQITDALSGAPAPAVSVVATHLDHGGTVGGTTRLDGSYTLQLGVGRYELAAQSLLFQRQLVTDVVVAADMVVPLDLALQPVAAGLVRGRVTAAADGHGVLCQVSVPTLGLSIETDAEGRYSLRLPIGEHQLLVRAATAGYRDAHLAAAVTSAGLDLDVTLTDAPTVLLVNGDVWRQEKMGLYYEQALQASGYSYDVYDIESYPGGAPDADTLLAYDVVIWSQPKTSPGYIGAWPAIKGYLNHGGNLLLTGQDIGYWDVAQGLGRLDYEQVLRATYVADDVGVRQVEGTASGILAGLRFTLNGDDSAQNQSYPSHIAARDGFALPTALYATGATAGLQVDTCGARILYLAFGLEGVDGVMRSEILSRAIEWLGAPMAAHEVALRYEMAAQTQVMGGQVQYPLTIVNAGSEPDRFDIRLDDASWPTALSLDPAAVELSACGSAGVTVTVSIPPQAAIGSSDACRVSVSSMAWPTATAVVTLETSAFPSWYPVAELPAPRSRLAAVTVDDRIYVVGGEDESGMLDRLDIYAPAADAWEMGADKPTAAGHLSLAVWDGIIYALGGYDDGYLDVVEAYDPTSDTWNEVTTLPAPRAGHGAAALDGTIYVLGGFDGKDYTGEVWAYDIAADVWTSGAAMPTARGYAAVAVVDGAIYVLGGRDRASADLAAVEVYDPQRDEWLRRAPMPVPRMGAAAQAVDGYIYVVGGGNDAFSPSTLRYDPVSDHWQPLLPLAQGRRTLALAQACGSLYAIGGWDGAYRGDNEALDVGASLKGATLTLEPALVVPGGTTRCQLTFANLGSDSLTESGFYLPIPAGLAVVPGSLQGVGVYGAGAVTWEGTVSAAQMLTCTLDLLAAADLQAGAAITLTASLWDDRCGPYARSATLTVGEPDLGQSAFSVIPSRLVAGAPCTGTITLTNHSLVAAPRVTCTYALPAEVDYVADSAWGGVAYDPAARALIWQGAVDAGVPIPPAYAWQDNRSGSASYAWRDTSEGMTLGGGDDVLFGPLPIGFDFAFYGQTYDAFHMSTNGYLTFGGMADRYQNAQIPDTQAPNNMVAVFWDDLQCDPGAMRFVLQGEAPNRCLVVEWHGVGRFRGTDRYTFQALLHEDGAIQLQYQDMVGDLADGSSATVGIENAQGSVGDGYLYNGAPLDRRVSDGLAVRFEPLASLAPGMETMGWVGRVRPGLAANTNVTHTVWVEDGAGEPQSLSAAMLVNPTDLSVSTLSVEPAELALGEVATWRVALRNSGLVTATAGLTVNLPAELTVISSTVANALPHQVLWQGQVMPSHGITLTIDAQVGFGAADRQALPVALQLWDATKGVMHDQEIEVIARRAQLAGAKTVSASEAIPGDVLTYTISLENSSVWPAHQSKLIDPLPYNVTVLTETLQGASYDAQAHAIEWVGTVPAANERVASYAITDSVVYAWRDPGPGAVDLELADDDYVWVALPFPIQFYGASQSHLAIGSNGALWFQDVYLGRNGQCPPSGNSYGVEPLFAALWADLDPFASGAVYYDVVGQAPHRQIVVTWQDVAIQEGTVSFQAVLAEDSPVILTQYRDVAALIQAAAGGIDVVIGLQRDATNGQRYRCGGFELQDGMAIQFAPQLVPGRHTASFQVLLGQGWPDLAYGYPLTNTAVIGYAGETMSMVAETVLVPPPVIYFCRLFR